MSVDKKSHIPRYYQLKELLEQQMSDGTLKPGDIIPSERDLASKYNLSRFTVARSISMLADEGLLYRKHGIGTFVSAPDSPKLHRRTNTIGLVLPDGNSSFIGGLVEGIEHAIDRNKYKILTHKITKVCKGKIDISVFKDNIDGLLLIPAAQEVDKNALWKLKKEEIPFVILNTVRDELIADCVSVDNISGAYDAVRYLIKLGHKKIALILNEPDCQSVSDRQEGYQKALQEHGIKIDPKLTIDAKIKPWQDSMDAGYKSMKKLLRTKDRPTAVFTISERGAIGALRAVRETGLKVPDDISIVSFDDSPMVRFMDPPLTVVAQPLYEIGEKALELLLRRIENNSIFPPEEIVIKPKLIIRESCCIIKH